MQGDRPTRTFDRRDAAVGAGLFLLALLLRLLYLDQAWALPFFERPIIDARSYDEWGRRIAAGDWLGERTFYQAPAYPYFLGLVYALLGSAAWTLRVVQAGLGAASCVLLYLATRALFGRGAGVAAGLLLAAYAPAIFFTGVIQKTTLGLFLTSALLLVLVRFAERPGTRAAFAGGLLLALLALTRENALALALIVPAWLAFQLRHRAPGRTRARWAGAFGLGLLLVLLPVGVRNAAVGGSFTLSTSQMGPNFYIGNNPRATGTYRPLVAGRQTPVWEGSDAAAIAEAASGRSLTPGEVSRWWMRRSLAWVRSDPAAWLALLGRKALYTVNDFELPDSEDLYFAAGFSGLLAALLLVSRFGVLFPLAVLGMGLAWGARREIRNAPSAGLLALMALAFAAAVAAFYVVARYRFPLVPLLIPFAGLAVARTIALLRAGSWRPLPAPVAAAALAALVAHAPGIERGPSLSVAWMNLGILMLDDGDLARAETYLLRAEALNPGPAPQFELARLRVHQRRFFQAEEHLLRADPEDLRVHLLWAELLHRQGRSEEARTHEQRARELGPEAARPAPR